MRIIDSNVQTKTTYRMDSEKEITQKLEVWHNRPNTDQNVAYVVEIGNKPNPYQYKTAKPCSVANTDAESVEDQTTDVKLKLIESLIYQMTGKTVKLRSPELRLHNPQPAVMLSTSQTVTGQSNRDGWGLVYEYQQTVAENESVQYNAEGTVTTSGGKTIAFKVNFSLSRAFVEQQNTTIRMGDAAKVDPLVVVAQGSAPALTTLKQDFDIDGDGKLDRIAFATNGSGFLALDKNGDGQINDGTELFGPQSGNGFEDLQLYDLDGNGWIDESDDVFRKLAILSSDQAGQRTLVRLSDVGIGAIYLQSAATPFSIKDSTSDYGTMRSSSFYLKENGTAGTIHHIDLSL